MSEIQVNENKLKELLGKINIEEIDSACPDGQDECPINYSCTECWVKYFQGTEPVSTEKPPMIKLVSKQLFALRNKPQ